MALSGEILACSRAVFVPGGWEVVNPDKPTGGGSAGDGGERARRRAQKRIETLIRANPALDVFWTLRFTRCNHGEWNSY